MQVFDRFLPHALLEDLGALRRGRVLVGTAFSLAVVAAIGVIVRREIGEHPPAATAIAVFCAALFAAVPWVLRATGSLTASGLLLTSGLFLLITGMGFFVGGIDGPVLMVAPLFPFLTTFLFGARLGTLSTLLMLLAVACFALLPRAGIEMPPSPLEGLEELQARGLTLGLTVLLAGLFAALYEQQRRFTEERLRRAEDLYRRVFSQSKDIVALTTPDGRVVDVNAAGVELYGFRSKADMIGWRATQGYADPAERQQLLEHLEKYGYVQGHETTHRTRSGELRILEGTTSTVRDANGSIEFLLAILHDVTDKRRADAEREAMLTELARKNAELEDFTYAVSHDLRGPLTTVRGYLGLIEGRVVTGDTDKIRHFTRNMDRAAEKMSRMLEDLLELSRVGRLPSARRRLSLGEVAREAAELVAGRIRETGAAVDVDDQLPCVLGDRKLLVAVFQNLIDNAVKFSAARPDPRIRVGLRAAGSAGGRHEEDVVFVQDNGVGIPPESQAKIFGVFHQLDSRTGGTGIGLATVKRAIEAHGWRVWVESNGREGSTFCFTVRRDASLAGDRGEADDAPASFAISSGPS